MFFLPRSGKFLKVSIVKDFTWSINCCVTPSCSSPPPPPPPPGFGICWFGFWLFSLSSPLLETLRRSHEDQSIVGTSKFKLWFSSPVPCFLFWLPGFVPCNVPSISEAQHWSCLSSPFKPAFAGSSLRCGGVNGPVASL